MDMVTLHHLTGGFLKIILPLVVAVFVHQNCFADNIGMESLEIIGKPIQPHPMTYHELTFISNTLYNGKLASHLDCEFKVREIKKEQKFLSGIKIVEMLQIKYRSSKFNSHEQTLYFPVGGKLVIQNKNSQFAGPVEEIQLHADDMPNNLFIFQHDGQGRITWASFVNDQVTIPCGVTDY